MREVGLTGIEALKRKRSRRPLRNFLDSDNFVALLFLGLVGFGVFSAYTGEWHWFSRFGSLLAIGGLLRSARAIIRRNIWDDTLCDLPGGPTKEELMRLEEEEDVEDLAAAQFGLIVAVVGTVVWGYGDLLGRVLPPWK